MKTIYSLWLAAFILFSSSLVVIADDSVVLYPTLEKNYRTNVNGEVGTEFTWNRDAISYDNFEIAFHNRIFVMQQFTIQDIENVNSVTLSYVTQSATAGMGVWLFPNSNWETPIYETFVEEVKDVLGLYPGATSGEPNAPWATLSGSGTRTVTLSSSQLAALKAAAIMSGNDGVVNLLLTTNSVFGNTNYKFYNSKSTNVALEGTTVIADNRPKMTVTYGAPVLDPIVNKTTGAGYATLPDAVTAASSGDILQLNENVTLTARLNVDKDITFMPGVESVSISRSTSFNNGILILATGTAKLTFDADGKELIIDGNNVSCSSTTFESGGAGRSITLKGVKVQNAISTNSQGIVSVKSSGSFVMEDSEFINCTVPAERGVIFAGSSIWLNGNNKFTNCSNNIYMEKAYVVRTEDLLHTTAISITLDDIANRTVNDVVMSCTDESLFTLTNGEYKLVANDTDLVFAITTGVNNILAATTRVWSANNAIMIDVLTAHTAQVLAIDGRCVRQVQLSKGINTIDGVSSGLYIVNGQKVVVR